MNTITNRLIALIEERGFPYEVIHHPTDYTAQETAADTQTPGHEFAKTVVLNVNGRMVLAVMPAHHRADFEKIKRVLGTNDIRLATESEMAQTFQECDLGAEPPLGRLFNDTPVLLASAMTGDEHITFNAGTHEDVIRMRYRDFVELAQPRYAEISSPV